nr:hypothetical protein [uncultured Pedobacter sp.]
MPSKSLLLYQLVKKVKVPAESKTRSGLSSKIANSKTISRAKSSII